MAIIGNAGGGKSTLARKIAATQTVPLHEIDQFLWQDGWKIAPETDYTQIHDHIVATDTWIIEGLGLRSSLQTRLDRATHIILCDFPLWQHYWLLAERQSEWAKGTLRNRPGGQNTMPPTKRLFEAVAQIEAEWMPEIRREVSQLAPQKTVHILTSFEALRAFEVPS